MNIWLMPSAFSPHLGGVEEVTLQLARGLTYKGHSVLVLTQRHPPELPARDRVEGIDVVRMVFPAPAKALAPATRYPISLLRTQAALLRQLPRPDIVNVHCASVQLGAAIPFTAFRRIPLVLSTHGELDVDADALFQTSVYARAMFRIGARRARVLTACSHWTAASAARVAGAFARATVIPNGIDIRDWPLLPPVSAPVVAAWGRHVSQKGFDLLLDAWPDVRRAVPDARLLIGGVGSETPQLEAARSAGVEFLGPLDRAHVKEMLSQARIGAVPSRLEPFGIVALEAMAAGRGVVWSTRGGLIEATGGLGWPVDPLNREELARGIVQGLRSETDQRPFRERAEELSVEAMTTAFLDAYTRAL